MEAIAETQTENNLNSVEVFAVITKSYTPNCLMPFKGYKHEFYGLFCNQEEAITFLHEIRHSKKESGQGICSINVETDINTDISWYRYGLFELKEDGAFLLISVSNSRKDLVTKAFELERSWIESNSPSTAIIGQFIMP